MGAWDVDVFANDRAADFLFNFLREQIARIEALFADEKLDNYDFLERKGIPEILPLVDMCVTLFEEYGGEPLVEPAKVDGWKIKYLNAFDNVDTIWAKNVKTKRREVIIETFDRFKNHIIDLDDME